MKRRAKVDYARWVFVLPALLVVGILLIYPIFSSLYYSMTTKHLIRLTYDFIGLENYKAVLADPNFFKAFLNSVLWTLGSLAGQLIIGFTGALAINRVNFGKGIYRTLMIIPWAFPSIVRDDVDAVIVATPNYLHKEPVVKAAEHGVNVFCEKPIALSYQDCDDMVRACQEHGVIFMAGHVMNFFHGVRHAKKLINDGVIGKVLYCHSARNGWEEQQPTISWKKIREKSGGHLYHHIHELDCVQFLMGGMPEEVTMTGGNVAHQGEAFGDEDDMLFVNMQFSDNRYAVLEWGSAFHWPEHYVLIQGTKGAIKIDMCDCGGTLKIDGKDEHFLVHESQEEDDDRTRIYHSTEMDGAIMYGKPGKKPPMWLHSIMKNEMKYLNGILHGKEVDEEFRPLLTGEAARAAIATADACTRSRFEDRKVKLSEIIG